MASIKLRLLLFLCSRGKTIFYFRGWEDETANSVAAVKWQETKQENIYRVGHKGKMDLKCIKPASGPFFYKDHLPVCGELTAIYLIFLCYAFYYLGKDEIEQNNIEKIAVTSSKFKVEDKVKVVIGIDILKRLQQGHGGWNPKMALVISTLLMYKLQDQYTGFSPFTNLQIISLLCKCK